MFVQKRLTYVMYEMGGCREGEGGRRREVEEWVKELVKQIR